MLKIDMNKVQINLGPNVGDMTTRYDPPGGSGSTTTAGYMNEARRVYKVTVYNKSYNRPKPRGGLRPVSINRHVRVDL